MMTIDAFFKSPGKLTKKPDHQPGEHKDDTCVEENIHDINDSFEMSDSPIRPVLKSKGRKISHSEKSRLKIKKSAPKSVTNGNDCNAPVVNTDKKEVNPDKPNKVAVMTMSYEDFLKSGPAEMSPKGVTETNELDNGLTDSHQTDGNDTKDGSKKCIDIDNNIRSSDESVIVSKCKDENNISKCKGENDETNLELEEIAKQLEEIAKEDGQKKKRKKRIKPLTLKRYDDTKGGPLPSSPLPDADEDNTVIPSKPTQINSMFQYFAKSSKPTVYKSPSKEPVKVKVEVHQEPVVCTDVDEQSGNGRVFDIFNRQPQKIPSPTEVLKKTPTSNVVVDAADDCIVELETSLDVTPVKKKKKAPAVRSLLLVKFSEETSIDKDSKYTDSSVCSTDETQNGTSQVPVKNLEPILVHDTDAAVAIEEKKKDLHAQMESLAQIKVPSCKSTQATLCFSKGGGFSVQKPAKTEVSEETGTSQAKRTNSRTRSTRANNVKNTDEKSQTGDDEQDSDLEFISPDRAGKRNALVNIYQATLEKSTSKARGPLKMKLKRIRLPDEAEAFTPKSKTPASLKAQELVQKAKNRKSKLKKAKQVSPTPRRGKRQPCHKTPEAAEVDETCLRRSSRRSAHLATESISLQYEERINRITATPKSRKSKQADKDTPNKEKEIKTKISKRQLKQTPKKPKKPKAATALASIFCKSRQESTDSVVTISSGSDDVEVTVIEDDPVVLESQRVRKAFLMSGVPEKLKKQADAIENKLGEYPPIPLVSHVQQSLVSDSHDVTCGKINPWCLTSVSLPIRQPESTGEINVPHSQKKWSLAKPNEVNSFIPPKPALFKDPINEDVIKFLLAEMNTENPAFPVRKTYHQLMFRRQENLTVDDLPKVTAEAKEDALKHVDTEITKKRKLDEELTESAPGRKGRKRRKESSDPDVVIIDDPEPPRATRSRSRLSTKKSEPVDAKDVPSGQQEETAASTPSEPVNVEEVNSKSSGEISMLWTDKYAPGAASEFIGNSKTVKKVKFWLQEWKQRTDLEARKLHKQQVRQAQKAGKSKEEIKKSFGEEWWEEGDSDFDLGTDSESEESEEEDTLCNTVLLTGPNGVGKTCLVHALAKDLGYKVFEVNTTSRRTGKQILAQLQEATQSHQVSKKNLDALYTNAMMMENNGASINGGKEKTQEKKVPAAFANFFGKSKDNKSGEEKKTPPKKNRGKDKGSSNKKRGKKSVMSTPNSNDLHMNKEKKKGLDLTSTSLILFEEADLVFEEDKGFWLAVQTFMSTTKRPMLLTANDPNFTEKFKAKMEHYQLRAPAPTAVASYLQTVALVENVRASFRDLLLVVEYMRCDVRACLLALQYWCASGASLCPTPQSIQYRKKFFKDKPLLIGPGGDCASPLKVLLTPKPAPAATSYDSSDDFEVARPRASRSRRMIIDDESSCDTQSPSRFRGRPCDSPSLSVIDEEGELSQASQASSQGDWGMEMPVDVVSRPADLSTPLLQLALFETTTGTECMHMCRPQQLLQQSLSDGGLNTISAVIMAYKKAGHDILYSNINQMLPLTKCAFSRLITNTPKPNPRRRRILELDDLFDSEGSSDGFLTVPKALKAVKERADSVTSAPEDVNSSVPGGEDAKVAVPADPALCARTLRSLSAMYDTFSACDSHLRRPLADYACDPPCHVWQGGFTSPGDSDSITPRIEAGADAHSGLHWAEIAGEVEARTFLKARAELQAAAQDVEDLEGDNAAATKQLIALPVDQPSAQLLISQERHVHNSLRANTRRTLTGVCRTLPAHVQSQRTAVTRDYMPTLRAMFLSEQARHAENKKRRFHHYLEDFRRELKDRDIDNMCSSFC